MPPVGAQVHRDAAGPSPLTCGCGCQDIRFAIGRIDQVGVASLPEGGDMIDVDS